MKKLSYLGFGWDSGWLIDRSVGILHCGDLGLCYVVGLSCSGKVWVSVFLLLYCMSQREGLSRSFFLLRNVFRPPFPKWGILDDIEWSLIIVVQFLRHFWCGVAPGTPHRRGRKWCCCSLEWVFLNYSMALLYEYRYWTGKMGRMGPSELVGMHKKKKEVL